MENQIRGLRKAGIIAITGLAGLVGSANLVGCESSNSQNISYNDTTNAQYINYISDYIARNYPNRTKEDNQRILGLYHQIDKLPKRDFDKLVKEYENLMGTYNRYNKKKLLEAEQRARRIMPWTNGKLRPIDKAVLGELEAIPEVIVIPN